MLAPRREAVEQQMGSGSAPPEALHFRTDRGPQEALSRTRHSPCRSPLAASATGNTREVHLVHPRGCPRPIRRRLAAARTAPGSGSCLWYTPEGANKLREERNPERSFRPRARGPASPQQNSSSGPRRKLGPAEGPRSPPPRAVPLSSSGCPRPTGATLVRRSAGPHRGRPLRRAPHPAGIGWVKVQPTAAPRVEFPRGITPHWRELAAGEWSLRPSHELDYTRRPTRTARLLGRHSHSADP